MNWSKSQQQAIDASGGTILVSAAAGSGKTAVLVERIINKIINENNNINIDELLIVTFSNAAASEIKERISKKLNQSLSSAINKSHIQKQQILLDTTYISTIHSFCQNLIRENFELLNVSPDFKIGNEYQTDILQYQAFSEIIDNFYNEPLFDNILKITDTTYNSDKLFTIIKNIFNFLQSLPFPSDWINKNLIMYKNFSNNDNNISDSFAAQTIFKYSLDLIIQSKNNISKLKNLTSNVENHTDYLNNLNEKLNFINTISDLINQKQWNKIYKLISNYEPCQLPRAKKNMDLTLKQNIKNLHNQFKEVINTLKTNYFCASEEDFIFDMKFIYQCLTLISKIINNFSQRYSELKKSKNLLDFSDLEHLVIKLLLNYDGNLCRKTNSAKLIANNFKEIFIDEYQDINLTQEYIFKAISKNETNLFMVGDSKQSIYRFRQARPQLFIEKNNSYHHYDMINFPAKITLNQNFRSRENVTSFINFIFNQLMSNDVGEINYDESQKLIPASNYPNNIDDLTEIHLLSIDNNLSGDEITYNEAKYIAKKINDMVKNKFKVTKNKELINVNYGDFCILLRSPNEKIKYFIKAFNDYNIPLLANEYNNFFETKEISTIISFLKVINNPLDDVCILAVMLSEIFNFSPDDVLKLKNYNLPNMFQAIKQDAQNCNLKSQQLYNSIKNYKHLANFLSLDKLLNQIYNETNFYNIVRISKNGVDRQFNLDMFKTLAKEFSETNSNSLIEFITYINKLIEQKSSLKINNINISSNSNYVKIMSIHKSKGLEFPICILADTSRQINKIDIKAPILLHPDIGFGINYFDLKRNVKYSTIPKNAIKLEIEKNMLSEELRILYVALTRAKEKIIIIISDNNYEKLFNHWNELLDHTSSNSNNFNNTDIEKIPSYILKKSKHYKDFFILSILLHPDPDIKFLNYSLNKSILINNPNIKIITSKIDISDNKNDNTNQTIINDNIDSNKFDQNIINKIESNINYIYPYKYLTHIPAKLGVSDIVKKDLINKFAFTKRPKLFYKHGLTNAEKGNIIHKFMQFANYEQAKENLDLECNRLLKLDFISKEEYLNLDKQKLRNFFNSKLYLTISSSKKIHREIRFVYPISIKQLGYHNDGSNCNQENIIVQGVADCVIEYDNEIIIIDYKTDKVAYLEQLYEKYHQQLLIYKQALSKIFHKNCNQTIIYSFYLDDHLLIQ